MSWCVIFSLGCVCWNSRHVAHKFICASILALILCQNTDLWASSFVFPMSMWFMCNCVSTLGMIMCLPFSNTPSITTSLSLYGQYGLMLVSSSSLVCGQPAIINVFSCWRWVSCNMPVVFLPLICNLACLLRSGWHPLICPYPL